MLDQDQVQKIVSIISSILDIDSSKLIWDASFVESYGADSMSGIEMLASIEAKLNITIHEDYMVRFTNLNEVLLLIEEIQHSKEECEKRV